MKLSISCALLAVTMLVSPDVARAAINVTVDNGAVWQTKKIGDATRGFLQIHNVGDAPDVLTGWTCGVADTTVLVGADGKALLTLTIPAGQTVTLAANGLHLLLQKTHDTVDTGSVVPCAFTFQNAGDIAVYLNAVAAPGAK